MTRRQLLFGGAAVVAAKVAATVDPDGEPVSDTAPLILVKAPNTIIHNVRIDASASRRNAIKALR